MLHSILYNGIIHIDSEIYSCNSKNLSELDSSSNKVLLQIVNFPSFLFFLKR